MKVHFVCHYKKNHVHTKPLLTFAVLAKVGLEEKVGHILRKTVLFPVTIVDRDSFF